MSYLKEHDDHDGFTASVVYMSNYAGEIEIVICNSCGYEDVRCTHTLNKWEYGGTRLICQLCGSEGT